LKTISFARKHKKPCLHILKACDNPVREIREFVKENGIKILNVAGSRESKDSGIRVWVMKVLTLAFFTEQT